MKAQEILDVEDGSFFIVSVCKVPPGNKYYVAEITPDGIRCSTDFGEAMAFETKEAAEDMCKRVSQSLYKRGYFGWARVSHIQMEAFPLM
jgi:hypothetical protein